ncbi:dihydrolipoyl dehydrogenase [Christensenellaceae bacterium OttesenSCG-928-K19]|nr:dihydrolipoyl dehydrogenase [Christensenellaceae bacterium OttesenSCG-928-K19]
MVYDLIVLGGGPAGYLACERAAHEGMSVLLFEKREVGGVCLNEGCIPTKTFLYTAKLKDGAEHGDKYGVVCGGASIDHAKVVKRKDKVVKTLTGGVAAMLKGLKVETIKAPAAIIGRKGNGYEVEADGKHYEGVRLLIATGSEAAMPPIDGLKEQFEAGFALTNREILAVTDVPKELVVIGGGVIGMEMASYFNSAGSTVTVVEMLEQVGGPIDVEIAALLKKNYEKKGITFKMGCKVTKIEKDGVVYETGGNSEKVKADKVLVSIGRTPNTEGIGLENIGVLVERRAVVTDEYMKTNQPNVYAAGDVNGNSMLAHTAYREAEVAVNNMLGKKDRMKYNAIPGVIYTNPEVAGVGETEQSAKEKGLDVTVKTISMRFAGRYVAENEGGDGICKLIVDNKWNKLIGVHMITNYASEIIWGADVLVAKEMNIEDIKKMVFPHPTVSEIIREAIWQL